EHQRAASVHRGAGLRGKVRRAPRVRGARAGPREPDRRAHGLQRGLRAPHGHRPRRVDRPAPPRGPQGFRVLAGFPGGRLLRHLPPGQLGQGVDRVPAGHGVGAPEEGPRPGRMGGRHRRRRPDRRRAVVQRGAGAGDGAGLRGGGRLRVEPARDGAARPARGERVGGRVLRDHGPDDLRHGRGGARPADRLPHAGHALRAPAARDGGGDPGHLHPPRAGGLGVQRPAPPLRDRRGLPARPCPARRGPGHLRGALRGDGAGDAPPRPARGHGDRAHAGGRRRAGARRRRHGGAADGRQPRLPARRLRGVPRGAGHHRGAGPGAPRLLRRAHDRRRLRRVRGGPGARGRRGRLRGGSCGRLPGAHGAGAARLRLLRLRRGEHRAAVYRWRVV
ncbi:MAG: Galactokinase, partial [uncultured Gemmatimonadetes bacterium]